MSRWQGRLRVAAEEPGADEAKDLELGSVARSRGAANNKCEERRELDRVLPQQAGDRPEDPAASGAGEGKK